MPIKISQLRTFVAVAELRNIHDAGARIGRSLSAVSVALKHLEQELGAPLFETDRKSTLSAVGRFVFDQARSEIMRHDRMMETIGAYARGDLGRVAIACVPSVASHILPGVIERFTRLNPGVELDVRDIDTAAVIRAIERGTVDIGIAGTPPKASGVEFAPWFRDELVLVCARDHPLAGRKTVTWRDLEGLNLIANGVTETLAMADQRYAKGNARLMVRNTTSLLALVGNGVGVTILPRLSVPGSPEGITTLALRQPTEKRLVGILWRPESTPTPAAETFIRSLAQWTEAQQAEETLAIEIIASPRVDVFTPDTTK